MKKINKDLNNQFFSINDQERTIILPLQRTRVSKKDMLGIKKKILLCSTISAGDVILIAVAQEHIEYMRK